MMSRSRETETCRTLIKYWTWYKHIYLPNTGLQVRIIPGEIGIAKKGHKKLEAQFCLDPMQKQQTYSLHPLFYASAAFKSAIRYQPVFNNNVHL